MGIYEFIALTFNEQAMAVWDGTFLSSRTDGNGSILLYDLGGFYVEVFYNDTNKKIERLRPFKTPRLVGPYLNYEISDLT